MGAIAGLFTIMWQAPHLAQSKYRIKSKLMNQSTRFLLICLINPHCVCTELSPQQFVFFFFFQELCEKGLGRIQVIFLFSFY